MGSETQPLTHTHRDQAHSIEKLNSSHAYLWEGREDPLERISIEAVGKQIHPPSFLENEWNSGETHKTLTQSETQNILEASLSCCPDSHES